MIIPSLYNRQFTMDVITRDGVLIRVVLGPDGQPNEAGAVAHFFDRRNEWEGNGRAIGRFFSNALLKGPMAEPLRLDGNIEIDGATMSVLRCWIDVTRVVALRMLAERSKSDAVIGSGSE